MLAFWEGPILMIKEDASPFSSVLGSPLLDFNIPLDHKFMRQKYFENVSP